jgi:hypothetical protein
MQRHVRRPAFGDATKIELHMLRQANATPDRIKLNGSPRPGCYRHWRRSTRRWRYLAPSDLVEISIIPQCLNPAEQRWIEASGAGVGRLNRYRHGTIEQS